jgi:3-hydroxyacyl-CoA dehydrogenase
LNTTFDRVAIVGAGIMGRSIALANLRRGIEVTLTDSSPIALRAAAKWVLRQAEAGGFTANVLPFRTVETLDELGDPPLTIEAIVENQSAKRRLFSAWESHVSADALLTTNTSSLSVSSLAESLRRPERFCGLHFCHPVAVRPLVEAIAAPHTAAGTLALALAYVESLGKRTLRTADVTGFAVNRLLFSYLESAVELVRAGVDWDAIESAGVGMGMPMGPLSQIDDIGVDVILRAAAALHRGDFQVPATSEPLLALYQAGRLGRKSGAGFFVYDGETAAPRQDPLAATIINTASAAAPTVTEADIANHLFLPMLAAAAELVERRIVGSIEDVRLALTDGLGWSGSRRDLLAWGADLPTSELDAWLERLALQGRRADILELLSAVVRSQPA